MNSKLLVMGFACLSVIAVAQSNENKQQPPAQTEATAPRDAASGQATGKRMHKPVTVTTDDTAREASTGKATGKTMASDDWQTPAAKSSQPGVKNVSTTDGKPNGTASTTTSNSDVKSPRDMSTGQASGKRQHPPAATTNHSSATDAPKK